MTDASFTVAFAAAPPWGTRLVIAVIIYLSCAGLLLTGLGLWPPRARAGRRAGTRDAVPATRDPVT